MTTETAGQEIAATDVVTLADVRSLAGLEGPCLTVVTAIPNPTGLGARLKNSLRSVEKQLSQLHGNDGAAGSLLAPVMQLAADAEAAHVWAGSLAAFRSPGQFRHFWLREALQDVAVAGDRFEIRSLLAALAHEQRFHVLALSRGRVRLLHATPHAAEETVIEGVAPPETDYSTDAASAKMGEKAREEDHRFLKEVERRVITLLRAGSEPLILAGVEHETALYRRLNRYPHLLDETIQGSPEGVTAQALHERGWQIVSRRRSEALEKALAEFRKHNGTARVLEDADAIVRAAREGRVAGLFLGPQSMSATGPDDPMNLLAIETLKRGGWAFLLTADDMPVTAQTAALLRF